MKPLYAFPILLLSALSLSCERYYGHMGRHHMTDYTYGGPFMWISAILLLAIIGVAVYFFLNKRDVFISKKPLDILKERYARGEITKDEYEEMKNNLQK